MSTQTSESKVDLLSKDFQSAWDALTPLRNTWAEKEQALLAKPNDSFGGSVTKVRITDASLSTLAFERQARVAAQLPTGKVYAAGKKDEGKAKLANIALSRYIVPNANAQGKDILVKQRLAGVYASVYGSMPLFVDYRIDDDYIGPDVWIVDPRNFLPQPGRPSIQECDWVMISTTVSVRELEAIAKRKSTNWKVAEINKLIRLAKDAKPSKYDDKDKDSETSSSRYSKELAKGEVELVTKYENGENGHWITFAPDYKDVGVLRDIKNPHQSGQIPVFMRDCFPLLNSIYGLGDFERGMKIAKAKDSLLALRLEMVKNKVFPALKIDTTKVTMSSIKWGNKKWLMSDPNAVQAMTYGNESDAAFQSVFSVLNTIQQNQFGTTDTTVNSESSANAQFGKTPQALKMMEQRENARDTWDRSMHEACWERVYEYMVNLLSCNMEKPINFTIFEEEIRQVVNDYGDEVLQCFAGNKVGSMTIAKKHLYSDKGFTYLVDGNSSMRQDDEAQFEALMQTFQLMNSDPNLPMLLQESGITYDRAEHLKKLFIAAGVNDWERILQEVDQNSPEAQAQQEQIAQQQLQEQMAQQQEQFVAQASQLQDPEVMQYAQQILGGQ